MKMTSCCFDLYFPHMWFLYLFICLLPLWFPLLANLLICFPQCKIGYLNFLYQSVGFFFNKMTLAPWLYIFYIFSPYMICFQLCLLPLSKHKSLLYSQICQPFWLLDFLCCLDVYTNTYTHTQHYTKGYSKLPSNTFNVLYLIP